MFWGVSAIALATRFAHVLISANPDINPHFVHPIMDEQVYDDLARGILNGTWPTANPFFQAPLYPYFLALLYKIFGLDNRLLVQLAHGVVSAGGAGLAALCAARIWNRRAGWLAGLLLAGAWTSVYFAGELLATSLASTLLLALLWALLAAETDARRQAVPQRLLLAGVLWGLCAVTRPNVLILVPVIAWYLYRHGGLRPPRAWLFLLLGMALPLLPVTGYNLFKGHDPVLIASSGGVNFYVGNNSQADGMSVYVPGTAASWEGLTDQVTALAENESGRSLRPSQVDRFYYRKGLDFLMREPGEAARLYAAKLRYLFAAGERSNNKNIYFWRDRSPLLRWPVWLGWAPILALAVLGWFRRDLLPARRFVLLAVPAAYAVTLLAFFVNARFRLPALALLSVAAGGGLDWLWTMWRGRSWAGAKPGLIVAAAVLAFAIIPDALNFRPAEGFKNPFIWRSLGQSYAAAGKLDRASRAYERAFEYRSYASPERLAWIADYLFAERGNILLQLGRQSEALQLYGRWTRERSNSAAAHVNLGDLLLRLQRRDEAIGHFARALEIDPDNTGALLGQAWILLGQGQAAEALPRFQRAAADGTNNYALFGVGLALIQLERLQEAETTFTELLRRQPDNWQALGNLAGVYERTGRLQLARQAYQRLLRLRPDDERARRWLAENP